MVQFHSKRDKNLSNNDTIYEVVMVAGSGSGPSVYNNQGNLSSQIDAFGRVRNSTPYTIFDSHNLLDKNEKYDEAVNGAGTVSHSAVTSSVSLNVSDASGDEVVRQSYRNFSYQPGKSLLILSTFTMEPAKDNLRQRVGYFDESNGIFFEQDGDTLNLVMRTSKAGSVTEIRVPQQEWNVDRLRGRDLTTIVLDPAKAQIFWTDIEWLGVGSVRCGFVINGQFVLAHIFHHANLDTGVYMTTPNLPSRYEITNTGATSGASTLEQICCTVISEGGYEARALERVIGTTLLTGTTVGTTYTNLATIRLRQNGAVVVPAGADILNIANTDFEWGLFKNVTPTTAFAWTQATNNVEYSLEPKTFSDTGDRVAGGYMGGKTAPFTLGDGGLSWDYQLGEAIDGTSDTFTLAIRASSSSKNAAGLLKWYEL